LAVATDERVCDDCGVALPVPSSPKRRYCSNACRQRARRRRQLGERVADLIVDGLPDDLELLSEPRLVRMVALAGQTEWRAAAWLLERLYPERFGRRTGKAAAAADDGTLDPFTEVDELAAQRRRHVSGVSG
jgi:hypothetical protein